MKIDIKEMKIQKDTKRFRGIDRDQNVGYGPKAKAEKRCK